MTGLGQKLRDVRLQQGKDLSLIASELRIGSRYLQAIEAGEWEKLPGGFFNRSFIRQYADYLGLPSADYEPELSASLSGSASVDLQALSEAHDPKRIRTQEKTLISVEPLRSGGTRLLDSRTGLTAAALILLVAAGAGLSVIWDRVHAPQESRQENYADAKAPVAPSPQSSVVTAEPSNPAAAEVTVDPADATIVPSQSTSVVSDQAGIMSLNIEATESTWIEVIADGKRIFVGTLQPGDSKSIASTERARMLVGNAGGIAVRKSGRDIGPIGPRGQVRVLSITPEAVEIMNPLKPKTDQPSI
jgi:cytoskeleton protein RodZ